METKETSKWINGKEPRKPDWKGTIDVAGWTNQENGETYLSIKLGNYIKMKLNK